MPDFDLKENAPMLLLVLTSIILMVTFGLPVGAERRRFQTRYQALSGFVGGFEIHSSSSTASLTTPKNGLQAPEPPSARIAIESPSVKPRPKLRNADRRAARGSKDAPSHRWPHLISAQTPSPIAASVEKSSATISSSVVAEKAAPAAMPTPAQTMAETADFVAEAYENDPAKYPMDRNAAQGAITLSLCGLSRQKNRYILKVSVTNRGEEDFFVKELSMRDGRAALATKSFFRLFVEPGRSREGFVIFDAPRTGADVHVALKEDREKGRVVEFTVPYSF